MTTSDPTPVPNYSDLARLDGKAFIVLGAGQGMGRQTSHALRQAGAGVFCVDKEKDRAEDVAREVDGMAWAADCTRRDEVERLVEAAVRRYGRLDGFVDIVGIAFFKPALDLDDAQWDSQFDLVLRHAYLVTQVAGRRMRDAGGGSMVFIASVSGIAGAPRHAAYGAAKAGLMSWVRSLAVELGPHGIRVNAVAPGNIATPRIPDSAYSERKLAEIRDAIPLGRRGQTSEIASAALFLSSPMAAYVSGQTLVVDGGVTCRFALPFGRD